MIKGEIPCSKVYEDDKFFGFLDIKPVSEGHMLLIPKEHYPWMQDVPDEIIKDIFVTAKKLMIDMKERLKCEYIKVSIIGKDVPHFHIHLIPQYTK